MHFLFLFVKPLRNEFLLQLAHPWRMGGWLKGSTGQPETVIKRMTVICLWDAWNRLTIARIPVCIRWFFLAWSIIRLLVRQYAGTSFMDHFETILWAEVDFLSSRHGHVLTVGAIMRGRQCKIILLGVFFFFFFESWKSSRIELTVVDSVEARGQHQELMTISDVN